MKKLLSLVFVGVLSASMLMTGCGSSSSSSGSGGSSGGSSTTSTTAAAAAESADSSSDTASGETIKIRFAGTVTEDHPITKSEYKFAELLEEYSGGQMTVEVYPNGQLGSNREIYESMQNGSIEMAEAGAVILANFTDGFKFMQYPYLFDSSEVVQCFLNSDVGQQMFDNITEETGFRILCCFENGWQAVTNSKHEITTVDDMAGLKIRTQENDILLEIYSELGCSPTPMAFTELFTGMQQGTVDGQVNPILIAYTGGYDEVQSYCTDVNAVYDVASVAINEDFYQSLTDEQRGWIDQSIKEACEWQLQASADATVEAAENINLEIHYLTNEERQTFKDAVSGFDEWFRANINEPNLDTYLDTIAEMNEMYQNGQLEAVTGNIIK